MAVVDADRHHQDLVDELIAAVEAYNPGVDKELLARAFHFAAAAHEGQTRSSGEPFVHHPWAVAKICAELHLDEQSLAAALLHDVARGHRDGARRPPRRVRRRDRAARRGRHEADADELPDPRAVGGGELPEDDRRDGAGRPRHPDQARRPAPQHAHDRVPGQAGAGAQGEGDARGLRAARAPPRHPRDQVGARGPLVRDPAPAQVRRDQGDGGRPARRPRGGGRQGGRGPRRGAGEGRHPRRDRRPREALLLDLRQDGQEGPRVQRDLRPDRDARDRRARRRRGDARLLRRARPDPLALEADAGAVQGLHRDAEVQPLPLAAHDRDRAGGDAARDPGADARDARGGRVRDRRALALQARQGQAGRRLARLGEVADGLAAGRGRPARVHEDVPHRPLRRRGLRLHAEGRGEDAAAGRDADRLRLRRPHRRRPQDGRREDQRPHRPAPLPAQERRLRRDPHLEVGPRAVARLDVARRLLARPQQDPAVVPARDARRDRGEGPRAARPRAEGAEPARTGSSRARPCSRR